MVIRYQNRRMFPLSRQRNLQSKYLPDPLDIEQLLEGHLVFDFLNIGFLQDVWKHL